MSLLATLSDEEDFNRNTQHYCQIRKPVFETESFFTSPVEAVSRSFLPRMVDVAIVFFSLVLQRCFCESVEEILFQW